MVMASAPQPDRMAAARAFARSLNIVLKHVRLYGATHRRSEEQLDSGVERSSADADRKQWIAAGCCWSKAFDRRSASGNWSRRKEFLPAAQRSGHFQYLISRHKFESTNSSTS